MATGTCEAMGIPWMLPAVRLYQIEEPTPQVDVNGRKICVCPECGCEHKEER